MANAKSSEILTGVSQTEKCCLTKEAEILSTTVELTTVVNEFGVKSTLVGCVSVEEPVHKELDENALVADHC